VEGDEVEDEAFKDVVSANVEAGASKCSKKLHGEGDHRSCEGVGGHFSRCGFEDRRVQIEEEKEENRVMMIDPTTMDPLTKEGGRLEARAETLEAKKARREASSADALVAAAAVTCCLCCVDQWSYRWIGW
jgi:hypothetical protein